MSAQAERPTHPLRYVDPAEFTPNFAWRGSKKRGGDELEHLGHLGMPGGKIVFSGVGKSREEIREALRYRSRGSAGRRGLLLFNIESEAELAVLLDESAKQKHDGDAPSVSIRVNPD